MKRHLLSSIFYLLAAFAATGTSVYFPLLDMTGTTNDTVINVKAVNNPIIWNNSFHWLPADGTNLTTVNSLVTNQFVPGAYTATVRGLPKAWKFYVTNSTSTLNAVDLSREIVAYSGIQTLTGNSVQVTNDGAGNYFITATNGASVAATNLAVASTNAGVVTINVSTQAVQAVSFQDGSLTNNSSGPTLRNLGITNGTLTGTFTNSGNFNGANGSSIPAGGYNQIFSGTNNTITGSGSKFNVILNGESGLIDNSIYSTIIGANFGTAIIEDSSVSSIISGNEAQIRRAVSSAIIGGEHVWIYGNSSSASPYNAILGGAVISIGDEFDDTKLVRGNVSVGGGVKYLYGNILNNATIAGTDHFFNNATNCFSGGGGTNQISGHSVIALGDNLTNSQNHEVMLGRFGTEVRVQTNGVTELKRVNFQGGTSSGNLTNTASWQVGFAGFAAGTLYTNGPRRGTLYFTGESGEFGAMVACSIVTYTQGGTGTNEWGKQTIYDTGDIAGSISITAPINPNQVYYVNTYGTSLSVPFFRIVYE